MSNWDDPDYVAAKKARAEAYAEFCRVAAENPHKWGQPEFMAHFNEHVAPVKAAYVKAQLHFNAEHRRITGGAP